MFNRDFENQVVYVYLDENGDKLYFPAPSDTVEGVSVALSQIKKYFPDVNYHTLDADGVNITEFNE